MLNLHPRVLAAVMAALAVLVTDLGLAYTGNAPHGILPAIVAVLVPIAAGILRGGGAGEKMRAMLVAGGIAAAVGVASVVGDFYPGAPWAAAVAAIVPVLAGYLRSADPSIAIYDTEFAGHDVRELDAGYTVGDPPAEPEA